MKTTNRRLRIVYQALCLMSARILPSRDAEKKTATLRRIYLNAPFEVTEERIRRIREDERYAVPDDLDSTQLPVAILEARQREIDTMLDEEILIRDIPANLLFEEKDLPRSFKGHEDNAAGVGDLMDALGFLYPIEGEGDAQRDERPADDRRAAVGS